MTASRGTRLLKVLDNTVSPMGARLLKRWLLMPLKDPLAIGQRLDSVELLIKDPDRRTALSHRIRQCGDIERLVARIPARKTGPRELIQLARGLEEIAQIRSSASGMPEGWLRDLCLSLDSLPRNRRENNAYDHR